MKHVPTANERAQRRRATWPIAVKRASEGAEPEIFGTPESRLRAVVELTEQCWALARKSVPTYARHETPVRLTRLRAQDDAET